MLVYEAYRWFRRKRQGPLERERQRACMIVVAFVWAIFVGSGAVGSFNRVAGKMLTSLFQMQAEVATRGVLYPQ